MADDLGFRVLNGLLTPTAEHLGAKPGDRLVAQRAIAKGIFETIVGPPAPRERSGFSRESLAQVRAMLEEARAKLAAKAALEAPCTSPAETTCTASSATCSTSRAR